MQNYNSKSKTDLYKNFTVAILIFALIFPFCFLSFPKKAEAIPVQEIPGPLLSTTMAIQATSAKNAVQNTMQTGLQTSLLGTETLSGQYIASSHQKSVGPVPFVPMGSWDQLANQLMKMMIGTLTATMVNWIQTGGSYPGGGSGSLFVNDIGGYMTSIADSAAGNFLEQVLDPKIFNLLCTPFRLPLYNALQSGLNFPYFQRARCTLSDIVNNTTGFMNGGFLLGGWDAWNELAKPQNNIYGSYLMAQSELMRRQATAVGISQSELSFGRGFLSFKTKDGKIATPGSIIEEQLSTQLGSGVRSLELADDLNKVIAAVVSRLITEILTGNQGVGGWQSGPSPAWGAFTQTSLPDISVFKTLSYSPLNPQSGQIMSFNGDIGNFGAVAAEASKAELKIDAGNNGTWDVSAFADVGSMQSGETKSVSWQNVWTAVPGNHKFRICADAQNSINESDESNNCADMFFQAPELAGLRPDLTVESADFSPPIPGVGELMTFRGTVKNTGEVSEASKTILKIDINNNGNWDTTFIADTGLLTSCGAETETWQNVWTASLGVHKFEICADADNAINEENENNNCASKIFKVIKKPDLIVSSVNFSPLYSGLGDYITFSGAIKNQGDAASALSQARLKIDTGNNGSFDVIVSPDQSVSELAPGETKVLIWPKWQASFPGLNAFEICADAGGALNESNEQNNCARQDRK